MKISYNWLKEFAPFTLEEEKAAEILTDLGLEIEGMFFHQIRLGRHVALPSGEFYHELDLFLQRRVGQ